MMTSRFASLTDQDIEKIDKDKDSQNTKRSTMVAKELFADYELNNVSLICVFYVFRNKLSVPLTVVTICFFFIQCVTYGGPHLPRQNLLFHGKTYFSTAKLTFPRQNLLFHP